MSKIELAANYYQLGRFTVNCSALTISNGDKSVKLPVKVFALLKLFIANNNQTITRSDAIAIIWDENIAVGERGFTNAMWHLRKAFTDLGAEPEEVFKTLRKVGYLLVVKPSILVAERTDISASSQAREHFKVSPKLASAIGLTVLMLFIAFYRLMPAFASSTQQVQYSSEINKITNFQGIEEQPAVSHDGRYLAFRWRQDSGKDQLYIKDLIDADAPLQQLTGSSLVERSPVWSPDDKHIAYLSYGKKGHCQVRVITRATIKDAVIDTGCVNTESRHGLDWSPDGKYLLYAKKQANALALFKYSFENSSVIQLSFPQGDAQDVQAVWSENSRDVALIRHQGHQAKLLLLRQDGVEQVLLDNKRTITGLAWDHVRNHIYTSSHLLHKANITLHQLDVSRNEWQVINHVTNASNIAIKPQNGEIFYSQFTSDEYIVQQNLQDRTVMRRISSSSRDMYGSYASATGEVLFLSNRGGNWDLWLKSARASKNLTQGFGAVASMPRAAPNSTKFVVLMSLQGTNKDTLVIGDTVNGKLQTIDTGVLVASNPSWSRDGAAVFFVASNDGLASAYQYHLSDKTIIELSSANEQFVIQGGDGKLYSSRRWQAGIWQFDPKTQQSKQIVDDLHVSDYGAFFWHQQGIIYLARSKSADRIKRINPDNSVDVIATYPANSIRQNAGIAAADEQSLLLTLNGTNDADINSVERYQLSG